MIVFHEYAECDYVLLIITLTDASTAAVPVTTDFTTDSQLTTKGKIVQFTRSCSQLFCRQGQVETI